MRRQLLLFILLSLIVLTPQSQNKIRPGNYKNLYDYAEQQYNNPTPTLTSDSLALIAFQKVILLLSKSAENDSILFESYVKSGILRMGQQQDSAALNDFIQSIHLFEKKKSIPDSAFFKSYLYAGSIHYKLYNFDSALYYYSKAEDIVNAHPLLLESERLYNKLGVLFYETGDYEKGIQYFKKALSIVEAQRPEDVFFVVNYKNNIASALRKLRRFTEAVTIYKSLLSYNINIHELFHNIGVSYLEAGDSKQAVTYLHQAQYNNQGKYNDLARASIALHQYDSAGYFLNKALSQQAGKAPNKKNIDYGISLKLAGDLRMSKGETRQALEKYQQALIRIDPDFNDPEIAHNPTSFYGLHNSFLLFDVLKAKAGSLVQLSLETKNKDALINAFSTYSSALGLARHVERMYHSDEAKLFLEQNVSEAYKEAVETGLQLYELTKEESYLAKSFNFAENSKASVLQADLHELELNNIVGLPESILKEQNILKANIARLNLALVQSNDSIQIQHLQNSLRDQEIRLSSLQAQLDKDPKYYQQKFYSKEINVDSIQKFILSKDEALLSYYYYNNRLLCFYITTETFGYLSSTINKDFFAAISTLTKQLNASASADRKLVSTLSTTLYQQLIAPATNIINHKKRLLIIPYNELSYIPFEVLTAEGGSKPLLYKFAISYNYSANFLSSNNNILSAYQTLAIAPFTTSSNDQGLPPLTFSSQEVEGLKGKTLVGEESTKQKFVALHNQYPVVHLATHAVLNDSFPLQSYIDFYKVKQGNDTSHRLYEQEIYQLDMQHAQLVILSACETGSGHLINEEGIISLSRAFSYAGCKSIVTSLWKADDAATAFIIRSMHRYLKKGFAKDEALQQAKKEYLESDEIDSRYKIPAYWAHLVLIGNNQPIVRSSYLVYIIFGIVIGVIATVFIIQKTVRKKGIRFLHS
jgi:CHAT domain-containing protein/Flp pilus assembly protein TadD